MLQHDYPAWHRPAQKSFFIIAVLLCISLPVVYGSSRRPRKISARTMGIVLGTYFGLWALFSLVVRFLVPSPKIETTLPTYTPSPIPVPVVLHSPSRSNAVPTSPAIRLHPAGSALAPATSTGVVSGSGPAPRVTITAPGGTGRRSARFADAGEDADSDVDNNSSRYSPSTPTSRTQQSNNVTFQTRPRGYTADSAHSTEFPTFAVYRQSQHGNFEALAQRFKRAFALSQQTNEQQQQQQQMAMMQSPTSGDLSPSMSTDPPSYSQTTEDFPVSSPTAIPLTATTATTETTGTLGTGVQSRSSTSAASMFSDIAGRLRSGSLFSRSNTNTTNSNTTTTTLPATRTATDQSHYTHVSSCANSEVIRPSLLSTHSHSASTFSHTSSPASHTATPTMDVDCTTTTISAETMPALELLLSQSPISPTGHDRTLSSTASSQTLQDLQQLHPHVHANNTNNGWDGDVFDEEGDVLTASSPQSQSRPVSTKKHSEKPSEPASPNTHHT